MIHEISGDAEWTRVAKSDPPICVECAHYHAGKCLHIKNQELDLVLGGMLPMFEPCELRTNTLKCDRRGNWFKPINDAINDVNKEEC
jgi:hypothetical protein